jgi:hypothetical protein
MIVIKTKRKTYERNGSEKYPSCIADSLDTAASSHVAMMASSPSERLSPLMVDKKTVSVS